MEKAIPYLAEKIAPKEMDSKMTVAILPFYTLDGKTSQFGKYISEQLLTELYNLGKFNIVDRALMDKVISEINLGMMGMLDASTAKELGKMLGADLVGTGTYTDIGKKIDINARLINAETGLVEGAAKIKIKKNESTNTLINATVASAQKQTKSSSSKSDSIEKGELIFEYDCNEKGG